jgi:hypothetical protein
MSHRCPPLELVVARHEEDLSWLKRVPPTFRVTVYNKGRPLPHTTRLPNIGREAHTYLHHLAERRSDLADVTVFVQGRPFDHAPDLHARLRALAEGRESVPDFHWLGFLADTDDSRGRRLFVPWSKNPARTELQLDEFHRRLFGHPGPADYRFFVGAQFAVTRAAAHRRTAAFYRRALRLAGDFPLAPHCFERCWDRIFHKDGTADRLAAGQLTAYFKPVKRLQLPRQGHPPLPPPSSPDSQLLVPPPRSRY